jgi:hypothetical protein
MVCGCGNGMGSGERKRGRIKERIRGRRIEGIR